ncbi:glycogen debranching protein GlgX [Gilvimarinus sp. F26214L]|uniref:glycogen debranching protein GlgX n=1 Tax=Gilvimarinus sp. DZF01 TaxID=3461371 RepID=UPI0040456646
MSDLPDILLPSSSHSLGAHWNGRGTHFAVFAEHAEKVELCIYSGNGRHQLARLDMPDCVHGIWSGYLPNARPGTQYGYRVYGPYEPRRGHRFNHHKLLLDPYARQVAGALKWHDALFGYRVGSGRGDLSFDRRDSAAYMPKAVVTNDTFDWGDDRPPRIPWEELVIYEAHLRGFTKLREDIPAHDRGTFGALGHPAIVDYLRRLGVNAIELLPIHLFARDRRLVDKKLTNYWGYNTLGFFCPDPAYLSDDTLGQLKWAVKQLHSAGIEVILDVVYNHTCEGNEMGPTLSWRGFGNSSYYRLLPEDPRFHINDTGCGNTLNMSHPRVIQMVMDSLRYWVQEFHIDGFRFDLCATLGRESYGFDKGNGFFDALTQDPTLAEVKLIAEPWDIGPGGHQVGNHPPRFAEWNDHFRDDVRRFWRRDQNVRGALAARLQGSAEIFDRDHRRPWASVNFITAHDGFTLQDLVSYEGKYNEANGEDNMDGTDNNLSRNWGAEGPTDDPAIVTQREAVKYCMLTTLLCAHGTPMLLAGDELGQSQQGNNNAYCQDNEISWLDWSLMLTERGRRLLDFTRQLIALRKSHALLQPHYYQHARMEVIPGIPDIFWFDQNGLELNEEEWTSGNSRHLALQRARRDGDQVELLVLLLNADEDVQTYFLPLPWLDYSMDLNTNENQPVYDRDEGVALAPSSCALLSARISAQKLTRLVEEQSAGSEDDPRDVSAHHQGEAAQIESAHSETGERAP